MKGNKRPKGHEAQLSTICDSVESKGPEISYRNTVLIRSHHVRKVISPVVTVYALFTDGWHTQVWIQMI